MLITRHPVETIYYLENPQRNISTYASTTQLTVESVVKDVFGVACVADIKIMLQYNKEFRKSISQLHNAADDDLMLEMVFRVASKEDLLRFKKSLLESSLNDTETSIECPFSATIQLQDGRYTWNESTSVYEKQKERLSS
ncbi:hypothetical protein ACLHDF_18740 [Priestia aryabhattai]|uniref:hypothetical protein n=1 Tax=Priestia megaterium TaxID=1404 RepID=UPI0039B8E5B4